MKTTLLITVTGRDRPAVTSRLTGALAAYPLTVLDIEQVVIRGHLVLGLLLGCDAPLVLTGIHGAVTVWAEDLGLTPKIPTARSDPAGRSRRSRLHVTLLGSPLTPGAINAIAA